jgi:sialidase-1
MKGLDKVTIVAASAARPRSDHASIIELRDGRLMIAYLEFCGGEELVGHDHAPSNIVSMLSSDGGKTWGERRVLVATNPGDCNVYNPCLLRLNNGEILFHYLRYHELKEGEPVRSSSSICRSRDEGRTFSAASCPEGLRDLGDLNTLVLLSSGRILLPAGKTLGGWCSVTPNGEAGDHGIVGCCYSDDDGRSWKESVIWVDLPRRGAMEPHVAELRDGRLLMTLRTELGAVFQSESDDGGITWSKPQTTGLRAPESMSCLAKIPQTGDLLLVWNHSLFDPKYDHSGKRTPLTVACSRDDGRSWGCLKNIETDPAWEFTNPACHFTSQGRVIITYVASPMEDPNPPGKLGRSRMSLRAVIADIEWFQKETTGHDDLY